MKSFKIICSIAICFSLLTACNKDDDDVLNQGDYLMFGHFYGLCVGESCVEIFRLESNSLLEDVTDNYPESSDYYEGDFTILPADQFDLVNDIIDDFPEALLNIEEVVLGVPDSYDQGGIYIEYNKDGVRDFWLLDQDKNNLPESLHDFVDKVNEKIQLINN